MQQNNFQGTLQEYIAEIKSDPNQYYQTGVITELSPRIYPGVLLLSKMDWHAHTPHIPTHPKLPKIDQTCFRVKRQFLWNFSKYCSVDEL